MYNNPYSSYNYNYSSQNLNDRIDSQIAQLQQMKEQFKNNQPAINQTFQLAPNNNYAMKFVNTIDDVNKEMVYADTPFFSKDMSVVWVKNNKNEIKTYELNEIIPKDDKDIRIEYLEAQIKELKEGIKKNESNDDTNEPITNTNESKESSNVSDVSKFTKKSK